MAVFGDKAPDEAELLEKTKQAGELESLKAVEEDVYKRQKQISLLI